MQRSVILALTILFAAQSTGASALGATTQGGGQTSLFAQVRTDLAQVVASGTSAQIGTLLTGNADRWTAMHGPQPARIIAPKPDPAKAFIREKIHPAAVGAGVRGNPPAMLLHLLLPKDADKLRPAIVSFQSLRTFNGVHSKTSNTLPMVRIKPSLHPASPGPRGVRTPSAGSRLKTTSIRPMLVHPSYITVDPSTVSGVAGDSTDVVTELFIWSDDDNAYDDNGPCTPSSTSSTNTSVATATGDTISFIGAGTATITFTCTGARSANASVTVTAPTPPPTAPPTPTPTPSPTPPPFSVASTGVNPWWQYQSGSIPGVGAYMVNIASGNLIVQSNDIVVRGRGIDLSFTRTYNSQSNRDWNGSGQSSDGSPTPGMYGNGWTNTFDAHIANNSSGGISVFDTDGARYDYTPSGTGCLTPPPGMYSQLCTDGGTGYLWYEKSGTVLYFYGTALAGGSSNGYAGRLNRIFDRNWNNLIVFYYYWANGDASNPANLTQIVAGHSDGQSDTLTFGAINDIRLLSTLTRPDGVQVSYFYNGSNDLVAVSKIGNNVATTLPEDYGYWVPGRMQWVSNPRWVLSSGGDGSYTWFDYDGSNTRVSGIQLYGFGNLVPNDGTNTPLQPGGTSSSPISYISLAYSSGLTQMTDTDGHATNMYFDASNRVTQARGWTGSVWLVSNASWDGANNLTETVDPRGNATDYAYDPTGNMIAAALPAVSTNQGTFRPTTLLSYSTTNSASNLAAACDPIKTHAIGQDWTGNPGSSDSLCPSASGAARVSWDYSDSNEPFGRPTDFWNRNGYHAAFTYSSAAQGGDFGLPTAVNGDCIGQTDGTSRCPQQAYTYNGFGAVASVNSGNGTWTVSYDSANRPNAVTDPDGVTNRACYYQNGQLLFTQTARQFQLDGGVTCGANSAGYNYDADGNLTSESHHFNNSLGTTRRWYDGADRLVEVSMPTDPTDVFPSWLTRYIYDLSAGGQVSVNDTFSTQYFYAHGNMYKTQRYVNGATSTGSGGTFGWYDAFGTSFDNADRNISNYRLQPGGAFHADTLSWDGDPGLPTSYSNAASDSMTLTYDADANVTRRTFSSSNSYYTGALPSENFTRDPDGRIASAQNDAVGMSTVSYDADGNIASYSEPAGGSGMPLSGDPINGAISSPTTYVYSYYGDGRPSSVTLSGSSLSGGLSQQYAYRTDGLLSKQVGIFNGSSYSFAQIFTNAGRLVSKSDPYANPSLTASYDSAGGLSSWTISSGVYNNFSHDAEGEVTSFSTPGNTWNLAYSTRGELLSESNAAQGSVPIAAFRSAAGYLYETAPPCPGCSVLSQTFDPRVGAALNIRTLNPNCGQDTCLPHTSVFSYDAAGRRTAYGREYDALGRILSASPAFYAYGLGTIPLSDNTTTHHSGAGVAPFYATDSSGTIQDVKVAASADIMPANSTYQGLTIYDRDFFGMAAAQRNSTGRSAWTISDLFSSCDTTNTGNLGAGTQGFAASNLGSCTANRLLYPFRTDGYFDGTLTFRGVRTSEPDTMQWSTPDAWSGEASAPITGLGYNYANNNPAMFSDPSGFVSQCGLIRRQAGSDGTSAVVGKVCFDDGQMLSDETGACGLFCDDGFGLSSTFDQLARLLDGQGRPWRKILEAVASACVTAPETIVDPLAAQHAGCTLEGVVGKEEAKCIKDAMLEGGETGLDIGHLFHAYEISSGLAKTGKVALSLGRGAAVAAATITAGATIGTLAGMYICSRKP